MPDPRVAAAAEQQAVQAIQAQPMPKPQLLISQPGITRDGTQLTHQTYIDGQWCRFWQDRPRKMLGYREQVRDVNGIARSISIFDTGGFVYVHVGTSNAFQRYAIDLETGGNTGTIDRTPVGFVASDTYLWQSDTIYMTSGGATTLFAVPLPTLNSITSDVSAQVYYGPVTANTALVPAVNVIAAAPAGVAFAQTVAGPGNLVLNVNAPIPVGSGNISVTTNANLSAINMTITGVDLSGNPLVVGPFALPNNATLNVGSQFSSISQASVSAGTGASTVSVGWLSGSISLTTSGGLVAVGPYLFLYGSNGVIEWSVPANPLNFTDPGSGDSRPVSDKIVRGLPLRGQSSPAAIFWSLSSLIIGNFVGGTTFWNFSTVSTNGSILGANAVVEHNGVYYWATTAGFSMFAGVMQDIPNVYNQQYFLDNLNFANRQKVFAYKVPRFKELWWCFPFGTATECNHAIVYNYEKNFWYDTPLPNGGRAIGFYDVTFSFPILSGVDTNSDTAGTSMWQHEFGLDEVSGATASPKAIKAFIRTHEINLLSSAAGSLGDSRALSFSILEPDFNQVGDLTMEVFSRYSARSAVQSPEGDSNYPYVIQAVPETEEDEMVGFRWSGRLTSFLIESNAAGGDFIWGAPQLHLKPSDGRRIG